jgi:ATP-dependent RNA helicase DDX46/PRP5
MARRNERSPHRTGSGTGYGGSRGRGDYRGNDRDSNGRRDDYRGGGHRGDSYRTDDRHRTRSRSPARRPRRDDDRGSYSRNDRRDDRYNPGTDRRTDLMRDRRRSRSPGRSSNGRSREGSYYRSRDDSRTRDSGRDTRHRTREPTPPLEDEKAKKLAKLEEWKQKQALKKKEEESRNSAVNILKEMDKKASVAPTPVLDDAKAISKRKVLQDGYKANGLATFKPMTAGLNADKPKVAPATSNECEFYADNSIVPYTMTDSMTLASSHGTLKGGKVGVFGFTGKALEATAESVPAAKTTLDFEDEGEESSRPKLEKLPTPPIGESSDAALANDAGEDDDEIEIGDEATEEEVAALAARREAAQAEVPTEVEPEDTTMAVDPVPDADVDMTDQEEVDPLDAYMNTIADNSAYFVPKSKILKTKARVQAEVLFGDDNGEADSMEAVEEEDLMALASKKKKKDLKDVDHKKIDYMPFKKEFYVEPVETKDMTEEDVANLRFELDGIKIKGKNVPKPVLTWGQCGLLTPVLSVIDKLGYEKPSPIQSQAIPTIMTGRDVIGIAKTGSGKTIAFLLPMFRHIKDQPPLGKMDGPIAIILAPTRELANQIHGECKPFVNALGLRSAVCFGQQSLRENVDALKRGVEIVVATPGRLVDLATVNKGTLLNFRRVTYFVMDEADRLWDMGFEPQVMKLIKQVRPDRQCIMFSATMPKNMDALARKVLHHPVEIVVGGRSVVAPEITQIIEVLTEKSKSHRLLGILGEAYEDDDDARVLIFVERQETADELLNFVLKKGYPCGSIHGGKDQVDRTETIEDFKSGAIPVMIATSVAARGLDVKQLNLVINFDAPSHLEDYVHRVGRTGRAGAKGTAITFITPDQERYSLDLIKALKTSNQEIPEELQKLADSFTQKLKEGKVKASSMGFGGKGLDKLDMARDAERGLMKGKYKTGDEPAEDTSAAEKALDEKILATATGAASKAAAPAAPPINPNLAKLNFDPDIVVRKTEAKTTGSAFDRVRAAAANIGDRLTRPGNLRPGQPVDNRGPDAGLFHVSNSKHVKQYGRKNTNAKLQATLEINDFPQKGRWAVTNRTNIAKVLDQFGVSITTKGNYYDTAKGAVPGPNDLPKLYLLVEGDTDVNVADAMRELIRLLKEATIAAYENEARAPVSGRYRVV